MSEFQGKTRIGWRWSFLAAGAALVAFFGYGSRPLAVEREVVAETTVERVDLGLDSLEMAGLTKALADDDPLLLSARRTLERGRAIFRYDRMGSQNFFSRKLKLHLALRELAPATALAVGLKIDSQALPPSLLAALIAGEVDLQDPANTVALIGLDAVVGVRGKFASNGKLFQVGITCALCHSVVDDSVAPGIGKRLDGWANRDLNVGAIIALAPQLQPLANNLGVDVATVKAVLASWGPGKFDAHLNIDGRAFRPDGGSGAVLIPPAFGLAGVSLATYTGWGGVTYWNAFVANLEMSGNGSFHDSRLDDPATYPLAVNNGFADLRDAPDVITSKLAALEFYQKALEPPVPPAGSYDAAAAARGQALFVGKAECSTCHIAPLFTEPGWPLHTPEELGIDDFQASRSPTGQYRTTPLRGLWTHGKGGYFHDGRFPTLRSVLDHYDETFTLGLSASEKQELEEYLKSL